MLSLATDRSSDLAPFLPRPLTSFIGREREVGAVRDLLGRTEVRLVTLTGPGGVGKTRLALAVATDFAADFADGVAFVGLAALHDPTLVIPTLARAVGAPEPVAGSFAKVLRDTLRDRDLLLLLDNFERLVEAAPTIVDLLAACPRIKALVTSRVPLRVDGEWDYLVSPLPLPDPNSAAALAEVATSAAVRLFLDRAKAAASDFVLTDETAPAVAEICRRVDGLPLAIELAAARIRHLPPQALLRRLDQRLPLLVGGGRDQSARHRSMREAIAWSYDLLSPDEQCHFRRLAVFVGGWTIETAEVMMSDADHLSHSSRPSSRPVLDLVATLIDHSLVRRQTSTRGEPRYTMLETVREFATEQLAASGEEVAARNAHAMVVLRLVEPLNAALGGSEERALVDRVQAEYDNIRAALVWSFNGGALEIGLQVAVAMRAYWCLRGPLGEAWDWLDQALALATRAGVPPALRAGLLTTAGAIANRRLDFSRAESLLLDGLAIQQDLRDTAGEADPLNLLGHIALSRHDPASAARYFEQALALWQELDSQLRTYPLYGLGIALHRLGDDSRATDLLNEAVALFRRTDDLWGAGMVLLMQAAIAQDQGVERRVAALAGMALSTFWELKDERDVFGALFRLACAAAMLGEEEPAARLLGAAEALRVRLGIAHHPDLITPLARAQGAIRAGLGEVRADEVAAAGAALPLAEAVAEALVLSRRLSSTDPPATRQQPNLAGMTPREIEVLRLIAAGKVDREIAVDLFVSRRTVNNHVASIRAKLGVRSRSAATAYAIKHGLV